MTTFNAAWWISMQEPQCCRKLVCFYAYPHCSCALCLNGWTYRPTLIHNILTALYRSTSRSLYQNYQRNVNKFTVK